LTKKNPEFDALPNTIPFGMDACGNEFYAAMVGGISTVYFYNHEECEDNNLDWFPCKPLI
jgi:hypothetical protein